MALYTSKITMLYLNAIVKLMLQVDKFHGIHMYSYPYMYCVQLSIHVLYTVVHTRTVCEIIISLLSVSSNMYMLQSRLQNPIKKFVPIYLVVTFNT